MVKVRVFPQSLEVEDDFGAALLTAHGITILRQIRPQTANLIRRIHANFDASHAYYKSEQNRAIHAEILSVVYGMG